MNAWIEWLIAYGSKMKDAELHVGGMWVRLTLAPPVGDEPKITIPALLDPGFNKYLWLPEDLARHVGAQSFGVAPSKIETGSGEKVTTEKAALRLSLPGHDSLHEVLARVYGAREPDQRAVRETIVGLGSLGERFLLTRDGRTIELRCSPPVPESFYEGSDPDEL